METSIGGEVAVATSPSLNRMAIDAQDLPELDAGQVYQLWAVQDGAYVSAGVLADPDQGAAMEMPSPGVQVAITIEPAGGSAVPSDDPIMSVEPAAV